MSSRGRQFIGAALDAVTYAATAAVITFLFAALVSFPLGYGLVGVKFGLFYLGFAAWAIAIVVSWPGSAWKRPNLSFDLLSLGGNTDDDETTVPWVDTDPSGESGEPDQTPYQALVQSLPPARFVPVRPSYRVPTGIRLFLAAFTIHATSFVMETVFGIAAV